MGLWRVLPIILIIFLSGCVSQISETQMSEQQTQPVQEKPIQQPTENTSQGESTPSQEQLPMPPLPTIREFTIEADDRGFYIDNKDISSVSVSKGDIVKITFRVREAGTYYGGLDFRGCGQDTPDVKPGASIDIQFTADSTCTITSYWPSSGVVKDSIQVIVS
ncbi:MAG: hypothetical protein QW818_02645 [Candidatus Aenigmatarchaeota archaeon]|nr:hypothetical protein [Candidatus Aenigmarchaeota archaeon]